jgi:hypothetical protein
MNIKRIYSTLNSYRPVENDLLKINDLNEKKKPHFRNSKRHSVEDHDLERRHGVKKPHYKM